VEVTVGVISKVVMIKKHLINIGPILSGYGVDVFEFLQTLSSEPCLQLIERHYTLHNLEQLVGDVNTFQAYPYTSTCAIHA
jgi:hypothetical protein